jgi:phage terminase Nu1 subunit (DNA packaging protein)
MADSSREFRFDALGMDQVRLVARLTPGQRIQAMLDAHELVLGLIRGRLQRQYPHLATREINWKVLEELERAERALRRP